MRWFWMKRKTPPEVVEAQHRLESIEHDDVIISQLERRSERVMREDNLAPYIMRVLGL